MAYVPTMTNVPFSWHHLNEWNLGVLPIILLLCAALIYYQWVAVRRRGPEYVRCASRWACW